MMLICHICITKLSYGPLLFVVAVRGYNKSCLVNACLPSSLQEKQSANPKRHRQVEA